MKPDGEDETIPYGYGARLLRENIIAGGTILSLQKDEDNTMIHSIAVIGAGTMGKNIALTFAINGYPVSVYDPAEMVRNRLKNRLGEELVFLAEEGLISKEFISKTLDCILVTGDLAECVRDADYIIEAIPEVLELKQKLLCQIDRSAQVQAIIGTNTSSLKLSDITEDLPESRRSKCIVCHWYNPAHLIPMVELSFFGNMSEDDYQEVSDLYEKCGKVPVKVLKDIPGMIANRLLHAQAREVFYLDSIGAASKEDLDKALMFGPCFRNATTGMFECADMGGLDIWMAGENNFFPHLDNSIQANPVMQEHVARGELGVKTGKGYYDYTEDQSGQIEKEFERRLIRQLQTSRNFKK